MTRKEENTIRVVTKFLRTIYEEDINICASVINAEANILSNNKVGESLSTLIKGLDGVSDWCKIASFKLNEFKIQSEL